MIDVIRECRRIVTALRSLVEDTAIGYLNQESIREEVRGVVDGYFRTDRPLLIVEFGEASIFAEIDLLMLELLSLTQGRAQKGQYLATLRNLEQAWGSVELRCMPLARILVGNTEITETLEAPKSGATNDVSPLFSVLVSDIQMQRLLESRWQECVRCLEANAPLASTVMMGGVLEGLLLAKIDSLKDKSTVFKATSAPKDKTGASAKLNEWGLKNFIDVAYELQWISKTTKDIGEVVRDYRNYIHPQKEFSHGISITAEDARMMWEVVKRVARQILKT